MGKIVLPTYNYNPKKRFEGVLGLGAWDYSGIRRIPVMVPKKRKVSYGKASQLELFDFEATKNAAEFYTRYMRRHRRHGLRGKEGDIILSVAEAIYGGEPKQRRILANSTNGNTLKCEPDLQDLDLGTIREVKGVAPSREIYLLDLQMAKYVVLQLIQNYKEPQKISFEIFRHNTKGLQSKFRGRPLDALVQELVGNIRFSLSVPFNLIYHLHNIERLDPITSRNNNDIVKYGYTRYRTKALDTMMLNPKKKQKK